MGSAVARTGNAEGKGQGGEKITRTQALTILGEAQVLEGATSAQEKTLVGALVSGKLDRGDLVIAGKARASALDAKDTTTAKDLLIGKIKTGLSVPVVATLADVATNGAAHPFNAGNLTNLAKLVPAITSRPGEDVENARARFDALAPEKKIKAALTLGELRVVAEEVSVPLKKAVEIMRYEGDVVSVAATLRTLHDHARNAKTESELSTEMGRLVHHYLRICKSGDTLAAARFLETGKLPHEGE